MLLIRASFAFEIILNFSELTSLEWGTDEFKLSRRCFLANMRCLSTTSRFVKLVLTPSSFLASVQEILVIEKSNAESEFEVL